MAERTNARLLKSREVQASGGSNPPPSAVAPRCYQRRLRPKPNGGGRLSDGLPGRDQLKNELVTASTTVETAIHTAKNRINRTRYQVLPS